MTLDQELSILVEEEPEGIIRLLLALSQGTIRGAGHDPPYLDTKGVSYYYTNGPYGVMFDDPIEAMHKTFEMRERVANRDWERLITPLEQACGLFVEGIMTQAHQTLINQITYTQQKEYSHDHTR